MKRMDVYDTPFYSKNFYDHKARWIHYFHQIRAVAGEIRRRGRGLNGFLVLEIGPSHGLVTEYLRKFGVSVTTLDYKESYKPDVVGDVRALPFADDSFDMAICCEVLEHMPFGDSLIALRELRRVSRGAVLMSVPDARRTLLGLQIKIPFFRPLSLMIRVPAFVRQVVVNEHWHNWEIGKIGYPTSRVRGEIERVGFRIRQYGSLPDTPRNYYFLLEKIKVISAKRNQNRS